MSIEARSAGVGKGSQFTVALPGSLVVETPEPTQGEKNGNSSQHPSRHVLIADDNLDAAETLGTFMELMGHEVHLAHTGAQALEVAKRFRPDIAVLDIGMPDVSGYEVARRIRLEAWGARVTLIAVTGWGQEDDKRRATAAGFNHHLTKPVDPEVLEGLFSSSDPQG